MWGSSLFAATKVRRRRRSGSNLRVAWFPSSRLIILQRMPRCFQPKSMKGGALERLTALCQVNALLLLDWTKLLVPSPLASHTLTSGSLSDRARRTAGLILGISTGHRTCNMSYSICNWVTLGPLRPCEAAFNQETGFNQSPAGSFPQMCVGYVIQMCFCFAFFGGFLHRLTHFRDSDAILVVLGVFCSSQSGDGVQQS